MNIKTRPFLPAEFQALIFATPNPWKSIYLLAYCTGLRISDLLQLERKPCPDLIQLKEQKTKRKNVIVVTPQIRDAWDYLYHSHDGQFLIQFRDPSTFRKSLVRHCQRCGISTTRIAFHSIRKTTATALYLSLGFVAASHFLNHSKLQTTLNYIELDAVKVGSALEASFHNKGV